MLQEIKVNIMMPPHILELIKLSDINKLDELSESNDDEVTKIWARLAKMYCLLCNKHALATVPEKAIKDCNRDLLTLKDLPDSIRTNIYIFQLMSFASENKIEESKNISNKIFDNLNEINIDLISAQLNNPKFNNNVAESHIEKPMARVDNSNNNLNQQNHSAMNILSAPPISSHLANKFYSLGRPPSIPGFLFSYDNESRIEPSEKEENELFMPIFIKDFLQQGEIVKLRSIIKTSTDIQYVAWAKFALIEYERTFPTRYDVLDKYYEPFIKNESLPLQIRNIAFFIKAWCLHSDVRWYAKRRLAEPLYDELLERKDVNTRLKHYIRLGKAIYCHQNAISLGEMNFLKLNKQEAVYLYNKIIKAESAPIYLKEKAEEGLKNISSTASPWSRNNMSLPTLTMPGSRCEMATAYPSYVIAMWAEPMRDNDCSDDDKITEVSQPEAAEQVPNYQAENEDTGHEPKRQKIGNGL